MIFLVLLRRQILLLDIVIEWPQICLSRRRTISEFTVRVEIIVFFLTHLVTGLFAERQIPKSRIVKMLILPMISRQTGLLLDKLERPLHSFSRFSICRKSRTNPT